MTSSRRSWERLAGHLAGRFRVVAYDQRGHGDSAHVAGPMALERGIRDLEEVHAAIGEPVDLLLGHSWGGAVVIEGGANLPVRRVAAVDPMIRQAEESWYQEFLEELREQFGLEGPARDDLIRKEYVAWSPVDVEGKVHAVRTMTAAPIEGLLRENPADEWDLRFRIATYDKPLLLAMADRGEGINEDLTLDEIEAERTKIVRIIWFRGAGHNLHRTAFDSFARALDDFLNRT
jgi:pimeloyl-ACP methyl ester carboxylesterase